MSLIPVAPFFTADFLARFWPLLLRSRILSVVKRNFAPSG
jgi:hypothetical protein